MNFEMDTENGFKEKGVNLTQMQKELLVEFVGQHFNVLFGKKSIVLNLTKTKLWDLLKCKLNAMGPPKEVNAWKRCFVSLKASAKSKFKSARWKLSEIDLKILKLFNMSLVEETDVKHEDANAQGLNVQLQSISNVESQQLIDVAPDQLSASEQRNQIEDVPSETSVQLTQDQQAALTDAHQEKFDQQVNDILQQQHIPPSNSKSIKSVKKQKEQEPVNVTTEQKRKIVELIGQSFNGLYGRLSNSANGDLIKKKIWKTIASKLNQMGGKKDVNGWKQCFTNIKASTKDKMTKNRQNKNKPDWTDWEYDDLDFEIIKMYKVDVLDGSRELKELGLQPKANIIISTITSRQADAIEIEHQQQLQKRYQQERTYLISSTVTSAIHTEPQELGETFDQSQTSEERQTTEEHQILLNDQSHEHQSFEQQIENQPASSRPAEEHQSEAQRENIPNEQQTSEQHDHLQEHFAREQQNETINSSTADEHHQPEVLRENRPNAPRRTQRRGVEINFDRFLDEQLALDEGRPPPRRAVSDDEEDYRPNRRRNRLSTPLSVMASESLRLQRTTNSLLAELVFLIRNQQ